MFGIKTVLMAGKAVAMVATMPPAQIAAAMAALACMAFAGLILTEVL